MYMMAYFTSRFRFCFSIVKEKRKSDFANLIRVKQVTHGLSGLTRD
jgi:hypothetical protein